MNGIALVGEVEAEQREGYAYTADRCSRSAAWRLSGVDSLWAHIIVHRRLATTKSLKSRAEAEMQDASVDPLTEND